MSVARSIVPSDPWLANYRPHAPKPRPHWRDIASEEWAFVADVAVSPADPRKVAAFKRSINCGDENCPKCWRKIAWKKIDAHERRAESTRIVARPDWITESTAERVDEGKEPYKRPSRANFAATEDDPTPVRELGDADKAKALELIQDRPCRKSLDPRELLSEAWAELLSPSADVQAKEAALWADLPASLPRLVSKAVERAQDHLRRAREKLERFVTDSGNRRARPEKWSDDLPLRLLHKGGRRIAVDTYVRRTGDTWKRAGLGGR